MFWLSLLAFAQSAAQGELRVQPNRWTVDYGRLSCTLARRTAEEGSPIIAFNAPLGREPGELVLLEVPAELERRLRRNVGISLDQGVPVSARARRERRNGRRVTIFSPMPDDFLDQVAAARQLTLVREGQPLLSLPLPDAREAVDELARCNDDLLQSWGVNVAARRGLRRQARLLSWSWALEIMPSAGAQLVFVADVSDRGAALGCRVVVSSGNERMDRAVCELVRNQGRFEPALDASGEPVRAQYVTRIRWLVDG